MATQPIYQFYAKLDDFQPKIWRRFQVAGNINMARLGYVLMTLFEMRASHLFCFEQLKDDFLVCVPEAMRPKRRKRITAMDIIRYEIPDEESWDDDFSEIRDATTYTLKQALPGPGSRLSFWYDFGDDWRVSLTLEDILSDPDLPGKELPRVLEGNGYGIIEDCGGTWGLDELAKVFTAKKGDRYEELRNWLGTDDLDLATFDIDDMNFRLKKIPRIYAQCYEQSLMPTQRSIDLIERRYNQI